MPWAWLVGIILAGMGLLQATGTESGSDCRDQSTDGWAPGTLVDASVVFRIENQGPDGSVRFCLFENGTKRFDETLALPSGKVTERRVETPTGTYVAQTELTFGSTRLGATHGVALSSCSTRSMAAPSRVTGSDSKNVGVEPQPSTCDATRITPYVLPAADLSGKGTTRAFVWVGVGSLGLVAGLLAMPRTRYALLLLFSRVEGSAVLDQPRRAQIYDLIRADPGIHPNRIRERLDLGSGETYYHLEVLRRNGVIVELRKGGIRCFFDRGLASPAQLRATAVLRHEPTSRLYQVVRERPGLSVSDLASVLGVSSGNVSKYLDRLEEAGLVSRTQTGKRVEARATGLEPIRGWDQA